MKAELMDLIADGMSYEKAGAKFGLTRGMVAGIVYREHHPPEVKNKSRRQLDDVRQLWTEARLTEKWEHRKLRRQREAQHGQAAG